MNKQSLILRWRGWSEDRYWPSVYLTAALTVLEKQQSLPTSDSRYPHHRTAMAAKRHWPPPARRPPMAVPRNG